MMMLYGGFCILPGNSLLLTALYFKINATKYIARMKSLIETIRSVDRVKRQAF